MAPLSPKAPAIALNGLAMDQICTYYLTVSEAWRLFNWDLPISVTNLAKAEIQ